MVIYLQMLETPEEKSKFEQIYLEYRGLMFHVAYEILHNEQDAEDAVHQALLKIVDSINKIEVLKSPKTHSYVVTIVENKAIDQYRKLQKHQTVELIDDIQGTDAQEERIMRKCMVSIILIIVGCIPFLAGGILNDLLTTYPHINLSSAWFSVVFLIVWGILTWIASRFTTSIKATLIPLHLVPFLNLLLLGIQLLILGQYWSNWIGRWSQYFYLPIISLAYNMTAGWLTEMFPTYCVCLLFMLGVSFIGVYLQKKRRID